MAVTIRQAGIKALQTGPITDFTIKLANRVKARAELEAPKFTGRLANSIERDPVKYRGYHTIVQVVTTTGYGLFPEKGTGIFGPKGRPIRPRRKRFLVFVPRGLNHPIRARSVKGQPPQHFMRNALLSVISSI